MQRKLKATCQTCPCLETSNPRSSFPTDMIFGCSSRLIDTFSSRFCHSINAHFVQKLTTTEYTFRSSLFTACCLSSLTLDPPTGAKVARPLSAVSMSASGSSASSDAGEGPPELVLANTAPFEKISCLGEGSTKEWLMFIGYPQHMAGKSPN